MSRPRQYAVAGDQKTAPAGKPVPTKAQILTVLDSSRRQVMARSDILVSVAALFGLQPNGVRNDELRSWARTVIDYNATGRLLDKMIEDEQLVGRTAADWRQLGLTHAVNATQAGVIYYASAARNLELVNRHEHHTDERLMSQAQQLARDALVTRHRDEYERLVAQAYEKLRTTEAL